jgi:hypothetical protein
VKSLGERDGERRNRLLFGKMKSNDLNFEKEVLRRDVLALEIYKKETRAECINCIG